MGSGGLAIPREYPIMTEIDESKTTALTPKEMIR